MIKISLAPPSVPRSTISRRFKMILRLFSITLYVLLHRLVEIVSAHLGDSSKIYLSDESVSTSHMISLP